MLGPALGSALEHAYVVSAVLPAPQAPENAASRRGVLVSLRDKYKEWLDGAHHNYDKLVELKELAESMGIAEPEGHKGRKKTWIKAILEDFTA